MRVYRKEAFVLIISFLIFPMALSFIYGEMQKNLFEGKDSSIKSIEVDFQYDRKSEKGLILDKILSDEQVEEVIHTGSEKSEYSVIISEDFKNAEIFCEKENTVELMVLKNFVEAILKDINQHDLVYSKVVSLDASEMQKSTTISNIIDSLNTNTLVVRERIVKGYKTLSSTEYYTISMFSFTSLILVVTLAGYFYKEVKEGIVKRTLSTPNDKTSYFFGFLLNSFIITFAISIIYVMINRFRGVAFTGNILHIGAIVLIQSLLCTSIAGMAIAFIKKEMTASVLMNILLVLPSIFGGVFFYNEAIESKTIRAIINYVPNALILNSYKELAITGNMQSITEELVVMTVLSIALLTVSIIKIHHKWEV